MEATLAGRFRYHHAAPRPAAGGRGQAGPLPASPEALYRDLPRRPGAHPGLLIHQGDVLRAYAASWYPGTRGLAPRPDQGHCQQGSRTVPAAPARLRARLTGTMSIASIPLPAQAGGPDQRGLDLSAAMFAPCSLGCRGTPRHGAALRVTRPPGLLYGLARHSMARHDAPLAQLAEQQTLNLRVRGSSPWRRTRPDLGFHRPRLFFVCPFCPHVCSTFAREFGPSNLRVVNFGPSGAGSGGEAPGAGALPQAGAAAPSLDH